jgi:hypothetical protein
MRMFVVLLAVMASQVFGADLSRKDAPALKAVKSYANSIGCAVNLDERNVVPYEIDGESVAVTLYSIDLGCSGGTAMSRPAFAVVRQNVYGAYVDPRYSSPLQTSEEFPQHTERLFARHGQLWYSGKEFNFETDALCCPSIRVEGKVQFREGKWVNEPK